MKRLLLWILALLILIGAAGYLLLTQTPGTVIALSQWQAARSAGLTERTVMVDGYETHYFEGGDGPVLVMLHGLGDSRHSFVETAGDLTDDHRVILPDLVGHGDNTMNPARDHSIAGQTTFLRGFFDALGLDTAVLAGNSMGGHIAAAFALDTPERVSKLILINAAGLVVNDTMTYDAVGDPLTSVATFDDLMARIVHNPPVLPLPIKQHLIVEINKRLEFVNAIAAQVRDGQDHDLSGRIRDMEVPTLVLWGEEDVIIPFAMAEAYAERIAGARLMTLPDAGHAPQLEAPKRVAAAIREFLRQTP